MDTTLTSIVSSAGLNFREQYNFQDNWNSVLYKFGIDSEPSVAERKSLTESIKKALDAAKFPYTSAGFQRNERAKGDPYWAFAVSVPTTLGERPLDRDIHGNLIFTRSKQRAG